jgi:hypothetical protein
MKQGVFTQPGSISDDLSRSCEVRFKPIRRHGAVSLGSVGGGDEKMNRDDNLPAPE